MTKKLTPQQLEHQRFIKRLEAAHLDYVLHETKRAYSRKLYYSERTWKQIAEWLLDQGYGPDAVVTILCSKHMRWCDDEMRGANPREKISLAKFQTYYWLKRLSINSTIREHLTEMFAIPAVQR